jgi:hypothetical protein
MSTVERATSSAGCSDARRGLQRRYTGRVVVDIPRAAITARSRLRRPFVIALGTSPDLPAIIPVLVSATWDGYGMSQVLAKG